MMRKLPQLWGFLVLLLSWAGPGAAQHPAARLRTPEFFGYRQQLVRFDRDTVCLLVLSEPGEAHL